MTLTRVFIDLAALEQNFQFAQQCAPKKSALLAMVKADAYGHGAVPVAKRLSKLGVRAFGVARLEEGIELRQAGFKETILVMGGLWGGGKKAALTFAEHRLTPVVHTTEVLPFLDAAGVTRFHLKIDTGMSRMGLRPEALTHFLKKLSDYPKLHIEGVMTHLAWRADAAYTQKQVEIFLKAGEQILQTVKEVPVWHLANSAAVMEGAPQSCSFPGEVWLRPGIMLYGISPYAEWKNKEHLKPVMSIVSQIGLLKTVPAGTHVSYNCTFCADRQTRLAVIPIGYADGYPWSLGNQAQVLVCGKRAPVVGRVTMDMIMVDVTDVPSASPGSEVVLLGKQEKDVITAEEIAAWAKTIPYEMVCGISKRLPKEYLG